MSDLCPKCGCDREELWEAYGAPEGSEQYTQAVMILENCYPCQKDMHRRAVELREKVPA